MKALVRHKFGGPEVVHIEEVEQPPLEDDRVLVRVRASSINKADLHSLEGTPRIVRPLSRNGLLRPKTPLFGSDVAGVVEAVGKDVTGLEPGDEVFGARSGAYAEYVSAKFLVKKPANVTFEEAGTIGIAGLTALQGLRDKGKLQPGERVLINGASGGVGTFAVQVARALGARADAVCSPRNADLVRSIGADDVIDYAKEDFTRSGRRYDVLLDIAGSRQVSACRRALAPRGTLVLVGGPAGRWLQPAGHVFAALAMGPLVSQRIALADTVSCPAKKPILMALTALIEDGKVTPVISRTYPFHDIQEAVRYQEQGHVPGKVVVSI